MRPNSRLRGLLRGALGNRRVLTYDDLDPAGALPGATPPLPDGRNFAHNDQLAYARMNSYFGH